MHHQPKPIRPEWHQVLEEKSIGNMKRNGTAFKLKWDNNTTEQAACKGLDTELFYPDRDVFSAEEERLFARMCSDCPVMLACLEWGLAHERWGVWGGTTPMRRVRERTRRGWVVSDPNSTLK